VASAPRAAWRRIRRSLAAQVAADLTPLLDERAARVHERLGQIEAALERAERQLRELGELAVTQVEIDNQLSELIGRQLRAAKDRIEELEERAGQRS
jgi:hypothetical protein